MLETEALEDVYIGVDGKFINAPLPEHVLMTLDSSQWASIPGTNA